MPFIKTGGLADVVGSLPKNFDKEQYDVRVILPYYQCIPAKFKEQAKYLTNFYMNYMWEDRYVGLFEIEY